MRLFELIFDYLNDNLIILVVFSKFNFDIWRQRIYYNLEHFKIEVWSYWLKYLSKKRLKSEIVF